MMSLPNQEVTAKKTWSLIGRFSRGAKRRTNTWLYTVSIIGVIVLLNVLAARFPWRFDATRDHQFSLAPQTKELLASLPGNVKAIGFYGQDDQGAEGYVTDLLKEYAHYSNGKLTWEVVDPAQNPSLVKQYGVANSGVLVLTYGDKKEQVDQWDLVGDTDPTTGQQQVNGEQALTNAINRLTSLRTPKVYLLSGHGEKSFSVWETQLAGEGYAASELNLLAQAEIPSDANLLVLAGPTADFSPQEISVMDKWLGEKGGRMTVMLDPGVNLPNLTSWLQKWGITPQNDIVVDPQRHYMYDAATPVPNYAPHAITDKLNQSRLAMVLPSARSLQTVQAKDGFQFDPLLTSSDKAWGETTLQGQPSQDVADIKGPLTMAVAVTRLPVAKTDTAPEVPEARLVVVGSSSFVQDNALSVQGNLDFSMDTLGWLADKGNAITIRAKATTDQPMLLTGQSAVSIFVGTVLIMPLAFLAAGGVIWLRRRHL